MIVCQILPSTFFINCPALSAGDWAERLISWPSATEHGARLVCLLRSQTMQKNDTIFYFFPFFLPSRTHSTRHNKPLEAEAAGASGQKKGSRARVCDFIIRAGARSRKCYYVATRTAQSRAANATAYFYASPCAVFVSRFIMLLEKLLSEMNVVLRYAFSLHFCDWCYCRWLTSCWYCCCWEGFIARLRFYGWHYNTASCCIVRAKFCNSFGWLFASEMEIDTGFDFGKRS